MAASHALSSLPQMSRLRHGVQPILVNTAEQPCHPVEESDPLTARVAGIKQAPSKFNRAYRQVTKQLNHGKAIMYEIDTAPSLRKSDSVHLTGLGNAIF